MSGRIALVTGGGGGIGGAVCRTLAQRGCRVAVADRDEVGARRVADEIDGIALAMDVTDPAWVAAAVASVAERWGGVEICVSAAGWDELRPFAETDEAFDEKVLQINLRGAIRVTRAVLPAMLEKRWGRLVYVASDAGRVGSSLESVYSAAKGGLVAFAKTVARETARQGVTSNSVCPGPTDTPLLRGIVAAGDDAESVIAAMTRAVPMKRLGTPEDVAAAVAFLASDEAAYITGQTLSVSGGLTMA